MSKNRDKSYEEFNRKWAHIIKKASTDEIFKQKLLNNPEKTLKENGIEFAPGTKVKIHESSKAMVHLTLPAPEVARDLSEEELRKVAGGALTVFAAERRLSGESGTGLMIHLKSGDVMSF